jgi:hypothetical protein
MKLNASHLTNGLLLTAASLLLISTITPCPGQAAAPAAAVPSGPRAQFSEINHNFGKISAGEVRRHDFIVTNVGTAILEISKVEPGCGCTTAADWDRKIEPGKTGKIPIQFNSGNFSGLVTKGITVTCNDTAQSVHQLQIQATVWRPIDVQPAFVHFMPAEGEETNETKVVRIVSNLDEPLTLQTPDLTNGAFKTEIKTTQPGKQFELHITHIGSASNAAANAPINIKTSSTNMPVVSVTAYVMPQPVVAALPSQIQMPATTAAHKAYVTIRVNGRATAKVTGASVNAEGVTVQTTEAQPGKVFTITVDFPAGFQLPAGKPLELTVNTSHPKRPTVHVPIFQVPGAPVVTPALPGASSPK